ncbi:hypothetical protein [Halohasta litorea]|uniref:Uncharacterized protein n=1 Tax=Halohasta litorea TaxID=869891 RepID=A0ABD6D879_9EURY|nr:hypothetical protein [Halohasta litorea]
MTKDEYSYSAKFIGSLFDTPALHRFREDFRLIIEKTDRFQNWDDDKATLRRQIIDGRDAARNSRIHLYSDFIGIVGAVLSLIPSSPFSVLTAIAGLLFILLGRIQQGMVEILVYDDPYDERQINRLKFMSAWNRGAMGTWKSYLILIIGPLIRFEFAGYLVALLIIDAEVNE